MSGKNSRRGGGKGLAFIKKSISEPTNECIEWPYYRMKNGYGQLGTHLGMSLAHRVACAMFYGPPPDDKPQAAHICGNRGCVNPLHLRWSNQSENELDKLGHGTWFTRFGGAKVNDDLVRKLRAERDSGIPNRDLARIYGIPKSTVNKIVNRITWKHVK